jgi:hypothetical protein
MLQRFASFDTSTSYPIKPKVIAAAALRVKKASATSPSLRADVGYRQLLAHGLSVCGGRDEELTDDLLRVAALS